MPAKKKTIQSTNGNGLRDYSHLPRLKDLPKPKKLTPLQKELRKATHQWLEALEAEQKKYGTTFT
jgi:hypothetical protein